jgi:WXXGXW repeat (2 copies)
MHQINPRRSIMRLVQTSVVLSFATFAGISTAPAQFAVGISITVAPPILPVYDQPPIPAVGYIWTPGYWAYGDDDYYWVPGTWVQPPSVGLLWTPGYWGWRDGIYAWNGGYWGPHVGFYGGVNYGFGYGGFGYGGGLWRGGVFSYNTTVNNFGGVHVTNVYNKTVIVNNTTNVSFNGGAGGTRAMPTAAEQVAARENHVQPTAAQAEHQHAASSNPEFKAANNGGHPAVGGTSTAGHFTGEGVAATHPHSEAAHEGGGAGNANHLMGGTPGGGIHPGPAAAHPAPAAAHPAGGNSAPRPTSASLNAGHPPAGRTPSSPPQAPHAAPAHAAPFHAAPAQAAPKPPAAPRVASAARPPQAARPAAPRPAARPAPRPAAPAKPHH